MISWFQPKLTPSSNFGSYGRTSAAMSVGSSRSKIGSSKRIHAHNKAPGILAPNCNVCIAACGSLTGSDFINCYNSTPNCQSPACNITAN